MPGLIALLVLSPLLLRRVRMIF